jgi:hypothetical protein
LVVGFESRGRLKILITVDVECDHHHGYEKMVFGRLNDGSVFGVEYIAKTLSNHMLKGVFFFEPLGVNKYGIHGFKKAMELVLSHGHEIQLHLHPSFKGGPDALNAYGLEKQTNMIREGLEILKQCGIRKTKAFRAGSFSADQKTLKALKILGIRFDSSYNLNYINSNCQISTEKLMNWPFRICSIWEFPVTCFDWPGQRFKHQFRHTQIGAAGFNEIVEVLSKTDRLGYHFVTILLHSFEFINHGKKDGPNIKNISRFEGLCRFLQSHAQRFQTVGFLELDLDSLGEEDLTPPKAIPRVGLLSWAKRNLEQLEKRLATR